MSCRSRRPKSCSISAAGPNSSSSSCSSCLLQFREEEMEAKPISDSLLGVAQAQWVPAVREPPCDGLLGGSCGWPLLTCWNDDPLLLCGVAGWGGGLGAHAGLRVRGLVQHRGPFVAHVSGALGDAAVHRRLPAGTDATKVLWSKLWGGQRLTFHGSVSANMNLDG